MLNISLADRLLVLGWLLLIADNAYRGWRAAPGRVTLGEVVAGRQRPPLALRLLFVALLGWGTVTLERHTGGATPPPVLVGAGLVLFGAALALHDWARRALGPYWSDVVAIRAHHAVVVTGPYAVVRHPIYAAILLAAVASLLVHPSPAIAALASGLTVGIALKIRREERLLNATLGADYRQYAARVPALLPAWRRASDRRQ